MRRIAFDPLAKPTTSNANQAKGKELWAANTRNCISRVEWILVGCQYKETRAHFNKIRAQANELLPKLETQNRAQDTEEEEG